MDRGKRTCLLNYLRSNNRQMFMIVGFMLWQTWLSCVSGTYNTQKHTHYIERYMRSHLIACLEKGHFSPFPQSTSSNTEVVKVYTRKIESICYCGKHDVFQNMVGCEVKRGRVKCSKWVKTFLLNFTCKNDPSSVKIHKTEN
jgi:hypothetical protein